jgi:hypothetical protein
MRHVVCQVVGALLPRYRRDPRANITGLRLSGGSH